MAQFSLQITDGSNALSYDPDSYTRQINPTGSTRSTPNGRKIFDSFGTHYTFDLEWNSLSAAEYELLRAVYFADETLFFSDGDVPRLEESLIYIPEQVVTFADITNPSSTHIAWYDRFSPGDMPTADDDYEINELATANYQALDDNDGSNFTVTATGATQQYIIVKMAFESPEPTADVNSITITIDAQCTNPGATQDGYRVLGWIGSVWTELFRVEDGTQFVTTTWSTQILAQSLVDTGDDYIRIAIISLGAADGGQTGTMNIDYAECVINDSATILNLSHNPILTDDDVISVVNTTQDITLLLNLDYEISEKEVSLPDLVMAFPKGVSHYYNVGNNLNPGTDNICFSGWMKTKNGDNSYLIAKKNATDGWAVKINGLGKLTADVEISNDLHQSSAGGYDLMDDEWHHLAVVVDRVNDTITRYVDGVVYGTITDTTGLSGSVTNAENLTLAAYSDASLKISAKLRGFRLYQHASIVWSASEIASQYADPQTFTGNGSNTALWGFEDAATKTTSIQDLIGIKHAAFVGGDTTNYGTHSRSVNRPVEDDVVTATYNRYFECRAINIPEDWYNGDLSSDRARQVSLKMKSKVKEVAE